ncbi:MAG: hypothetical protein FGM28_02475 [Limnohabitans sp.]|nr:hypothetical protein [Limnohabitans sp.]
MNRLSPVQLIDSYPLKMRVELAAPSDRPTMIKHAKDIGLEFYKDIRLIEAGDLPKTSGYSPSNTYQVSLGVRSAYERPFSGLDFEFVYAGRFVCTESYFDNRKRELSPECLAYQYGLTILYGSIRETFTTMANRMGQHGAFLPVLSFMEEKPPETTPELTGPN